MNEGLLAVHGRFMRHGACWRLMPSDKRPRPSLTAVVGTAVLLAGLCAAPLHAGPGSDDNRRALAARQGGRILPLASLIAQVDAVIPGRLLKAELDEEDGTDVYELRWQLADGRRLELEIDARDGRWLKLEGPRLETVFRRGAH